MIVMPLTAEDPLRQALCDTAIPLVQQFLGSALADCPEDFAEEAAVGFCEIMLVDRLIHLLRERPELLDYLYGDPGRG